MIYAITGAQDPVGSYEGRLLNTFRTLNPKADKIITGACIGIDWAAARIAHELGFFVYTIVPANKSKIDTQFYLHCHDWEYMPPGTSYMDRNDRLVNHPVYPCDCLLAFPNQKEEILRSGTWATIRRARKLSKEVRIISPY
jgi:hypothetical protein